MAKQGLYGKDITIKASTRAVTQEVLMAALQLLHPFMPFVTEEIWEKLPGTEGSIMIAKFPELSDFIKDENAVKKMHLLMGVITGIRNIRGEMNIPPSKKVNIVIDVAEKEEADFLSSNLAHIKALAKVEDTSITSGIPKPEASATAVFGQNQIHVLLKGVLDFQEERKRLGKQIEKLEKDIEGLNRKLSNRGFLEKAPAEIVKEASERVESLSVKLEKLNRNLQLLETIGD
jgi:valyl-tRNA synthetase